VAFSFVACGWPQACAYAADILQPHSFPFSAVAWTLRRYQAHVHRCSRTHPIWYRATTAECLTFSTCLTFVNSKSVALAPTYVRFGWQCPQHLSLRVHCQAPALQRSAVVWTLSLEASNFRTLPRAFPQVSGTATSGAQASHCAGTIRAEPANDRLRAWRNFGARYRRTGPRVEVQRGCAPQPVASSQRHAAGLAMVRERVAACRLA
jgi:hypothetical protein